MAEMSDYDGLTYFSAAHKAGLLLQPTIGCGEAWTQGRQLRYEPRLPYRVQREQIIRQIAERLSAGAGSVGAVLEYALLLDAAVLPV